MKNKYIHRDMEPLLLKLVKQFPSVVVTGPRQSGKSTLLKELFSQKYNYLSFDDPLIREQAISDPKLFLENAGEKVIIDEIQYVPQILSYVKIIIDQNRDKKGRFIFTGSQQFGLMKELGESLAGRIGILELLPFSVKEKQTAYKSQKNFSNAKEYFIDACLKGSYPEIIVSDNIETNFWYGSYLQTYLERDIRTLYNIGNLRDFQRLMYLLAARCSQILNLSSLASDLGIAVNSVKKWISVLETSRIIYLLSPYYNNFGKRTIKNPKIYFLDCGLLCYLLSLKDHNYLLSGPMAGALFENFCIQETIKNLASKKNINNVFYLRTSNALEIDLILENNGQIYPVEIKLSKTPNSAMAKPIERFKILFASLKIDSGTIVSLQEKSMPLTKSVSIKNMDDYLEWLDKKF